MRAVDVSPLDADLLDATVRLVRLIDRPADYRALAPLVVREIVYRLLTGAQAGRMRHLATFGGQAHRMVRAVEKLRENFDKPLRIEAVARELGMSAVRVPRPLQSRDGDVPLAVPEAASASGGAAADARRESRRGRGRLQGRLRRPGLFQPRLQKALRRAADAGCGTAAGTCNGLMQHNQRTKPSSG